MTDNLKVTFPERWERVLRFSAGLPGSEARHMTLEQLLESVLTAKQRFLAECPEAQEILNRKLRKKIEPEKIRYSGRQNRPMPVICLNDGKVYRTGKEAGLAYGMSAWPVRVAIQTKRPTKGGLEFRFVEVPEEAAEKRTDDQL